MPYFQCGRANVYFAHVPKCGGTSVEAYLALRFGPLAFLDTVRLAGENGRNWSLTSPQHIDRHSLAQLFPPGFFTESFAVVRDPVARLVSSFYFFGQNSAAACAPERFSLWLRNVADHLAENAYAGDNHLRAQSDIVPESSKVFKLEDGLDKLVPYLDGIVGNSDGPRSFNHWNTRKSDLAKGQRVTFSRSDCRLIARIYAVDYERFGYALPDSLQQTGGDKNAEPGIFSSAAGGIRESHLMRRTRIFMNRNLRLLRR